MNNETQFTPIKYVAGRLWMEMTGANSEDIQRGLLAAEQFLIASGVDVYEAVQAATTQEFGEAADPQITTSDEEWDLAEVWRNAERLAVDACSAGRAEVYADVGQGLGFDAGGPGRWFTDNPYSLQIETNTEDLEKNDPNFNLWCDVRAKYSKTLTEIFGNNNAMSAIYFDAHDEENPRDDENPSATRKWLDRVNRARELDDQKTFDGLVTIGTRPHRMPRDAALKLWTEAAARAKAAALGGMTLNRDVQFKVSLCMTE